MDYKKKIRDHIAKGETDKAITLLMEYTQQENSPFKDDAVLISGQYRQWKREINLGIEQSSSDLRRIELSIMELLNQKETAAPAVERPSYVPPSPASNSPEKSNKKYLIYGAVSLALLLVVFAIGSMGGDDFDLGEEGGDGFSNAQTDEIQSRGGEIPVNSSNVVEVVYADNNGIEVGKFLNQTGTDLWVEIILPSQEEHANFIEESRDATSVYLYDEVRDVNISLDIENGEVWYSQGDEQERKINSISTWSGPTTTY